MNTRAQTEDQLVSPAGHGCQKLYFGGLFPPRRHSQTMNTSSLPAASEDNRVSLVTLVFDAFCLSAALAHTHF